MKRIGLLILCIFNYSYCFGPKKFTKSPDGNYWCRDRINHPGRQCCESVSQESITAPKIFAKKSKINVIDRGYGNNCDHNCACSIKKVKCKKKEDCKQLGKNFVCNKGDCALACKKDDECLKKLGNGWVCQKGFCTEKQIIQKRK